MKKLFGAYDGEGEFIKLLQSIVESGNEIEESTFIYEDRVLNISPRGEVRVKFKNPVYTKGV
jgi:hypothetical protein